MITTVRKASGTSSSVRAFMGLVLGAGVLTLSACSSVDGETVDAATSAVETSAAEIDAQDLDVGSNVGAFDDDDAAEVIAQLGTDEGRERFITQIMEVLDLTRSEAECFVDNIPTEAIEDVGSDGLASANLSALGEALIACDISLEDVLNRVGS